MMKRYLGFVLLIMVMFFPTTKVDAASLGVSATATTVTPGTKVTIYVKANDVTGKISISNSDSSVLSGATGTDWVENNTNKYEFTAKSIGSSTVTIKTVSTAESSNGKNYNDTKTIKITVVKPREKSTNNNLSKLEVEGYSLEPSFNKDTLEYKVNISKYVENIKINANLEDKYAKLDGTGEKEVIEGDNKFTISVTSETGNTKTYTVNVVVHDENPIEKVINGKTYTVVKRIKSLVLPDVLDKNLFKESTLKIDDNEVPMYVSEDLNLNLIGLKDSNGSIYLYQVVNNEITDRYEVLTSNKLSIIFTNPKEEIEGLTKTTITIDNKEYEVYKLDSVKNVLIYGKNSLDDVENWYQYNEKEKTLQSFDFDLINKLNSNEKEYNDKLEQYKLVIIGLCCLALLLLVIVLVEISSKSKLKKIIKKNSIKNKTKEKEEVNEKLEEKVEIKEKEIAKQINKKEEKKKTETKKIENVIEEEFKNNDDEIIPDFDDIKNDLKDTNEIEDDLMDPDDFLDIKRKKKKKK